MGGHEGIKSSRGGGSVARRRVRQVYNQLGSSYERLYGLEQSEKHNLVLKLLCLDSSQTVLDVGCGSGRFARRVARKIRFIVGIDISNRMIQRAKKASRRDGRVEMLLGDAEHLPFRQDSFQVILAITVILNATPAERTIRELKALCEEEGMVVLTSVVKASGFSRLERVIERGFRGWKLRKKRLGADMGFFAEHGSGEDCLRRS